MSRIPYSVLEEQSVTLRTLTVLKARQFDFVMKVMKLSNNGKSCYVMMS